MGVYPYYGEQVTIPYDVSSMLVFRGVFVCAIFPRVFAVGYFSTARTFGAPQVVTSFSIKSPRSRVSEVSRFPRQPKNGVVLFRGEVLMLMFLYYM